MIDKKSNWEYGIFVCFLFLFSFSIWIQQENSSKTKIASSERFLTSLNYSGGFRNHDAYILAYGINDREQFEILDRYVENIDKYSIKEHVRYLVGTKCDLNDQRVVTVEEGEAKAKEINAHFIETSAKLNINVNELFLNIFWDMLELRNI